MNWYICGGTENFRSFLKELCAPGDTWQTFSALDELSLVSGNDNIYILLPEYEKGARWIPVQTTEWMDQVRTMIADGTRFYVENYFAQDYLHSELLQAQIMGRERFFFQEYIEFDDVILQARDAFFFPGVKRGGESIGRISNCIGTHKVFREGTYSFPCLIRNQQGNMLSALMNFSAFDPLFRRPYGKWKTAFGKLFASLTGQKQEVVEKSFVRNFPDVFDTFKVNSSFEALDRAIQWHDESGLLCAPDGTKGMYEMILSSNLQLRKNLRTDATLLTAALYTTAGKVLQKPRLTETGIHLADFLYERGIQRPDGFLKWFDHSKTVWASDCGRDGLAIWQLYKVTREERFRRSAFRLADAFLQWLKKDGICTGSFTGDAMPENGNVTDNPVYYGEMAAFLFQLREEKYTTAALRAIRCIGERFPRVAPFGFSDNFTYSRWLLMLASAQYHTDVDFSEHINPTLEFFQQLQEPCGGLRETAIRIEDKHPEAGIGIGDGSDAIADLLYCNNFVLNALSILKNLPAAKRNGINIKNVSSMYTGLRDFLLRIQIRSSDPRLNGGWMRGYDMGINEYYGLNKDLDWGTYCIMAGWVMGFLPMVFLNDRFPEESFFY